MRRLVLGLMTALSLSFMPVTAASALAGDPNFHRPTEGDCHDYAYAGLYEQADTSPIVLCTERHTAKVHKVFLLPDSVSWSDLDAVGRAMDKRCRTSFEELLGRSELTHALTAYGKAWFIPTKAERNQGARWVRCDVVLFGGNTALAPLAYDAAPLVPNPITDSVRKCLTGKYYWTTCERSHSWRASGDFNVRKGKYPTAKQMRAIAIKKCSPMVTSSRFHWVGPTKEAWKHDYRVMVCFSKTTR